MLHSRLHVREQLRLFDHLIAESNQLNALNTNAQNSVHISSNLRLICDAF